MGFLKVLEFYFERTIQPLANLSVFLSDCWIIERRKAQEPKCVLQLHLESLQGTGYSVDLPTS